MAADGNIHTLPTHDVKALRERNDRSAAKSVRTLIDTSLAYDAQLCGFPGKRDFHDDGEGFRITYDGRYSVPAVTLNGLEGEVCFNGVEEMRAAAFALNQAVRYAELHGGR